MGGLVDNILGASPVLLCLAVFALVFVEDALFVGFVVPGETAAIIGGVAASRGHVNLWVVMLIVVLAAITGDTVGYEVGRKFGPRLLSMKRLDKHRGRLDNAQELLARRGGMAVFLGRFTAFFRAVMPALAGMSRMHYPRFLAYNAAGGILWSVAVVLLGYVAGNSYQRVAKQFSTGAAVVVAVLVVAGIVVWQVRKRRHESAEEAAARTAGNDEVAEGSAADGA